MRVYRVHGYGWHNTYQTEQEFTNAIREIEGDPFESVMSTQILERIDLPNLRDAKLSNEALENTALDIFDVRKLVKQYTTGIKQGSSDQKAIFILPEHTSDVISLLIHSGLNVNV